MLGARLSGILLLMNCVVCPCRTAEPCRFELIDTSLRQRFTAPRSDEHERPMRAGEQPRKEAAESAGLGLSPVNVAANGSNLQAYGGCDVRYAQQLGADFVIAGECKRSPASSLT